MKESDLDCIGRKQAPDEQKALMALRLIVEGGSVRSAMRITGLEKRTILRLIVWAGVRCESVHATKVRNVPVRDVQGDEIWGYVAKKEGHKRPHEVGELTGDAWCFIGIERHTKLVLAYQMGKRNEENTDRFMLKLAEATFDEPFQLTTDGFACHKNACTAPLEGAWTMLSSSRCTPRPKKASGDTAPLGSSEKKDMCGAPKTKRHTKSSQATCTPSGWSQPTSL